MRNKLKEILSQWIKRVILGEDKSIPSWVVRGLLLPFSVIYILGLKLYLLVYDKEWRKLKKLNVPVISVGNITFGGTGKTPLVQTLTKILQMQGKRVVILSRGHGGKAKGSVVVSDGKQLLRGVEISGDEPMLLAISLRGVPVIVGKDRYISGKVAIEMFKPDVMLLDDGMQYWQLMRDLDIALVNADKPFGSGFVMPAGDMRESARGLARAEIIIINNTSCVSEDKLTLLIEKLSVLAPYSKIFICKHRPAYFKKTGEEPIIELDWAENMKAVAFCGIGNPDSFFNMLRKLDVDVISEVVFDDHYIYTEKDIEDLKIRCKERGADVLITTEKDVARMIKEIDKFENLYSLSIRTEVEDSVGFEEYIANRLNKKN